MGEEKEPRRDEAATESRPDPPTLFFILSEVS